MTGTPRDRGSASIELAILVPVVLVFFIGVIIAGRFSMARQATEAAAYNAARTASLSGTAATAASRGRDAAAASFAAEGITCRTLTVTVDTRGFSVPVGQPATVTVRLTCEAEFADIALPGMPGSARLTSEFTSPLDTYRSRT
ncbi:TadE family protein [Catellatospora bangladeshensis]|uniref:Membrane protein n=1 Tax=Catellatospora bangladeshensis TaxID=310355 RepID=A0A8J3JQY5_9ACTN|nr:TadE family protein [Catellatospora bangladeshensis]GIF83268.1 membrane protein [Catellatospora bangladeshensis]